MGLHSARLRNAPRLPHTAPTVATSPNLSARISQRLAPPGVSLLLPDRAIYAARIRANWSSRQRKSHARMPMSLFLKRDAALPAMNDYSASSRGLKSSDALFMQ